MRITALSTMLLVGVAACGNDQPAERDTAPATQQPAAAQLTMPDWFQVDHDAQTVTMDITAGSTSANNYWNFNGYVGGEGLIVVPEGYEVTINFDNQDPAMAHSIGVDSRLANFPANFSDPTPVFEGGISSNPTSLTEATMPGESETITFTASQAGEYTLVCYIPGHAMIGMYVHFNVSADGEAGVRD
jgi:FtsP/CotA-like multicopper oxidase with cupredoxin domain